MQRSGSAPGTEGSFSKDILWYKCVQVKIWGRIRAFMRRARNATVIVGDQVSSHDLG